MATAKLNSPATSLLAGGRTRRSAPARCTTVIRAAAGSYSDELISTAVSPPFPTTKPYICPFSMSVLTAGRRILFLECCTCLTRRSVLWWWSLLSVICERWWGLFGRTRMMRKTPVFFWFTRFRWTNFKIWYPGPRVNYSPWCRMSLWQGCQIPESHANWVSNIKNLPFNCRLKKHCLGTYLLRWRSALLECKLHCSSYSSPCKQNWDARCYRSA